VAEEDVESIDRRIGEFGVSSPSKVLTGVLSKSSEISRLCGVRNCVIGGLKLTPPPFSCLVYVHSPGLGSWCDNTESSTFDASVIFLKNNFRGSIRNNNNNRVMKLSINDK
jgi:hypothetical protein